MLQKRVLKCLFGLPKSSFGRGLGGVELADTFMMSSDNHHRVSLADTSACYQCGEQKSLGMKNVDKNIDKRNKQRFG